MNKNKKAIDMTPEELNERLASLPASQDDALCPHFSDPDPYFQMEHTPRAQSENRLFNKNRHLTVHNCCAAELPDYRDHPLRSDYLPFQRKLQRYKKSFR